MMFFCLSRNDVNGSLSLVSARERISLEQANLNVAMSFAIPVVLVAFVTSISLGRL